jgi:uncharacterized linocin/CFP29 family protein
MPVFSHEENPLNEQEWKSINSLVIEVARRRLVGRRIVDLYGPLGSGVQTIVHEQFAGTTIGSVSLTGDDGTDPIRPVQSEAAIIPLVYKDFIIHWRDVQYSRQSGAPLDTSAASAAASLTADAEDNLVFNGGMGAQGLMNAEGRQILVRRDWTEPGNPFQDVVDAMQMLVQAGFYGPYAMLVTPQLYAQLFQIHPGTGVLEIETIRQLMTEGVYQSPLITEGCGAMVATGSQNFDLVVAQDLAVAFLGGEKMNLPFRVFESVYFRIKRAAAIVTLEAGQGESKGKARRGK